MLNGLFVACIEFILLPVVSLMQPPDPTPLLQPHYRAFVARTSRSAPVLRFGLSPRGFGRLGFSLNIGTTGSCSSVQSPASASRPLYAGRHPLSHQAPSRFFPEEPNASGFDDTWFLTTRPRRFTFVRLSDAHLRECSRAFPPTLPTTALNRSSSGVV